MKEVKEAAAGRGWLDQVSAADHIGVSVRTLRNYIAAGHLPAYRIKGGRGIRILRADLEGLMQRIPTVDPETR